MTVLSLLQRCIFNKITSEPDILRRGATTTTTTTCVWMVHRKSAYVYVCAWVRVCSSNYILLLITVRRAYSTYMCSTIRLIFFFYRIYVRRRVVEFELHNYKCTILAFFFKNAQLRQPYRLCTSAAADEFSALAARHQAARL